MYIYVYIYLWISLVSHENWSTGIVETQSQFLISLCSFYNFHPTQHLEPCTLNNLVAVKEKLIWIFWRLDVTKYVHVCHVAGERGVHHHEQVCIVTSLFVALRLRRLDLKKPLFKFQI